MKLEPVGQKFKFQVLASSCRSRRDGSNATKLDARGQKLDHAQSLASALSKFSGIRALLLHGGLLGGVGGGIDPIFEIAVWRF